MPLIRSSAVFSECRLYRYQLTRTWNPRLPKLVWCMLNPSTADAWKDDPTIRRCIGFSSAWRYGGLAVVNLYALRATDSSELWEVDDPVGPDNDDTICQTVEGADVIAAWGAGSKGDRAWTVSELIRQEAKSFRCLGVTAEGHPRHPLFLPKATSLIVYHQ